MHPFTIVGRSAVGGSPQRPNECTHVPTVVVRARSTDRSVLCERVGRLVLDNDLQRRAGGSDDRPTRSLSVNHPASRRECAATTYAPRAARSSTKHTSRERTKDTETTDKHLKGLDAFKSGVREPTPSNTDVRLDSPRLVALPLQNPLPRFVGGLTGGVDCPDTPRCRQAHGVDSPDNPDDQTPLAGRGTIPPMRSTSECPETKISDQ